MQQGNKPTPAQLAADFGAIEKAAHRLLHALQVTDAGDFERMPYSLRFGGLSAQAHSQAMRGKAAVGEPRYGDTLLRHAVEGVRDLHRWSKAARQRELEARARRPPAPKFEGNPALRDFVGYVVVNGWWATWGREVRDSARLQRFIIAAAKLIGLDLSEDAARGQLRAAFANTFADRRTAKLDQTNG